MVNFQRVYSMALANNVSEQALKKSLPKVLGEQQLLQLTDTDYLTAMSRRTFQAGLSRKVIEAKWEGLNKAFFNFNCKRCAFISDDEIAAYMNNPEVIRHLGRVKAVRANASMIEWVNQSQGSFVEVVAKWPVTDIVGLWRFLQKHGRFLGGRSAAMVLRSIGKDTFILSDDVVALLLHFELIDTDQPKSQKALQQVQGVFNQWHQETGLPMAHLSRIASMALA